MQLGVNIDHVATLREARKTNEPDPLEAVYLAKAAGADQITVHLREDRRHIHDFDLKRIVESSALPVNLECAISPEMLKIACALRPHRVTLVPEKREEVTTEGGLDVIGRRQFVSEAVSVLRESDIETSLFVDPDPAVMTACVEIGASMIELHTGSYANLYAMRFSNLSTMHHTIADLQLPRPELEQKIENALTILSQCTTQASEAGLKVAAGHGLNYQNVHAVTDIAGIFELNIGHSIVSRAVMVGFERAVREMKVLLS